MNNSAEIHAQTPGNYLGKFRAAGFGVIAGTIQMSSFGALLCINFTTAPSIEVAQQAQAFSTNPDHPSLIPGTLTVEGEN